METPTSTLADSTGSLPTSPEQEEWYLALRNLTIPNARGKVPSSIDIAKGVRFQLDGDEPINLERLRGSGAFKVYEEGTDDDLLIESEKQARREAASKRRMRRSRGNK
jgi:hypothetical protein